MTFSRIILIFLALSTSAFAQDFHGIPVREHRVLTSDGATLSLVELQGNEGGQVVLIQPGLMENAAVFTDMAAFFHRIGYHVVLGQSRFAGTRQFHSQSNPYGTDGLREVLHTDVRTTWQYVYGNLSGGRPFHYIGHSMGAMAGHSNLGNRNRTDAFSMNPSEMIATFIPLMGPGDFNGIHPLLQRVAPAVRSLLQHYYDEGRRTTQDLPHSLFGGLARMRNHDNRIVSTIGNATEAAITQIGSFFIAHSIIDPRFTTRAEMRHLMTDSISPFPIRVLMDFANSVISGQFPVYFSPEEIVVPTMVVGAEFDKLAPIRGQYDLYSRLTSAAARRFLVLRGVDHVDPVVSARIMRALLPEMVAFMRDPHRTARISPYLELRPENYAGSPFDPEIIEPLICEAQMLTSAE